MAAKRLGYRAVLDWFDVVLAVAIPLSTQISVVTGTGRSETQQAHSSEGPVTPAKEAFAIWAPIFVALLGFAGTKLAAGGANRDPVGDGMARASLVGNLLWSLNAQYGKLGWASFALISGSAANAMAAVTRYEFLAPGDRSAKLAANLLAPLAGWLTVASFANLDIAQRVEASPTSGLLTPPRIVTLAATTAVGGTVLSRGNLAYVAAAGWGLGGIVFKNHRREPAVAAAAGLGLAAVLVVTLLTKKSSRTS